MTFLSTRNSCHDISENICHMGICYKIKYSASAWKQVTASRIPFESLIKQDWNFNPRESVHILYTNEWTKVTKIWI